MIKIASTPYTIAFAGMVGTGKTTVARHLSNHLGSHLALEPVGLANPWLDRYYTEDGGEKRYGLPLQLHFLTTRMEQLREMRRLGGNWVLDTTWYADAEVFARNLYEKGTFEKDEFALYNRIYGELLRLPESKAPDVLIFLDGSLGEIISRIRSRNRESEQGVDMEYWRVLHKRYREWIDNFDKCPVLRLDITTFDLERRPDSIESIQKMAFEVGSISKGEAPSHDHGSNYSHSPSRRLVLSGAVPSSI